MGEIKNDVVKKKIKQKNIKEIRYNVIGIIKMMS